MAVKFTEEMIDDIVEKYQNGMSVKELAKTFSAHEQTITSKLKQRKVFAPKTHNWTDEDTKKLLEVYPSGDWDLIMAAFPNRTKVTLHSKASKLGIKMDNYFWNEHDKNILIKFYGEINVCDIQKMLDNEYTSKQIQNQAQKMNLTKSRLWTDDEINIMLENYSKVDVPTMTQLLSNRTADAIKLKAEQLGLKSLFTIEQEYTGEQKQFILDNWENMSDEEMAQVIGKSKHGVADQRRKLALYYPKNDISYYGVDDFIRHRNYEWKKLSMQNCNYKCVITGDSDFEIHHTYSFNLILKEAMKDKRWISKDITEYTDDELETILSIFFEYQSKYPLGVCVSKDYHKMFHSIYGNRVNTPEQWDEFLNTYINIPITD